MCVWHCWLGTKSCAVLIDALKSMLSVSSINKLYYLLTYIAHDFMVDITTCNIFRLCMAELSAYDPFLPRPIFVRISFQRIKRGKKTALTLARYTRNLTDVVLFAKTISESPFYQKMSLNAQTYRTLACTI